MSTMNNCSGRVIATIAGACLPSCVLFFPRRHRTIYQQVSRTIIFSWPISTSTPHLLADLSALFSRVKRTPEPAHYANPRHHDSASSNGCWLVVAVPLWCSGAGAGLLLATCWA